MVQKAKTIKLYDGDIPKNLNLVADPNSTMIYLWILVAESNVVAANDTTRTTISVIDKETEKPIC